MRAQLARGSIIYDKADARHIGLIRQINHQSNGKRTATVRWLETGWLSFRIPLRDLRRAAKETYRA